MASTHKPRFLDKVWDESRIEEGLQANGYIHKVFKDAGEVTDVVVKFHDSEGKAQYKTYSFGLLDGCYKNETMGYLLYI